MYNFFLKRVFDFFLSLFLLLLLIPVLLIIILVQMVVYRGQSFFLQERPGKHEKPFHVIKFKTMSDEEDDSGVLLPNHKRITKSGAFLRKTSLDEIPQLINVLKGEMSFVGPRPLLFKYVPLYSDEQRRRHDVMPGITGWAQINGRNAISWAKKFELDVYYVDNISFLLDMKILFRTFLKVIKSEGVNAGTDVTMPPFDGTN